MPQQLNAAHEHIEDYGNEVAQSVRGANVGSCSAVGTAHRHGMTRQRIFNIARARGPLLPTFEVAGAAALPLMFLMFTIEEHHTHVASPSG